MVSVLASRHRATAQRVVTRSKHGIEAKEYACSNKDDGSARCLSRREGESEGCNEVAYTANSDAYEECAAEGDPHAASSKEKKSTDREHCVGNVSHKIVGERVNANGSTNEHTSISQHAATTTIDG